MRAIEGGRWRVVELRARVHCVDDGTDTARRALDDVRRRLLGKDASNVDSLRAFIEEHPFWSAVIGIVGIAAGGSTLVDELEPLFKMERNALTVTEAMLAFTNRGWAISSFVPVDSYRAALAMRSSGATEDEIDVALTTAWNESQLLHSLPARIKMLGAGDDSLGAIAVERSRLVGLAWGHHLNGSYEASIPIVLAQVDGITHDATTTVANPKGSTIFSSRPDRQADVTDAATLAGIEFGLPAVREWFSASVARSAAHGTVSRHGVMHGRELRYDSRANSTKSFVLLLAIWEWANRQLSAQAQHRRQARYDEHTGADGVDENGWRLDRRGFTDTRTRLRTLALAQSAYRDRLNRYGSRFMLMTDPASLSLVDVDLVANVVTSPGAWSAWLRSDAGWAFGIGGRDGQTHYWDGYQPIDTFPPADGWRTSDAGNWSGDCHW